MSCGADLGYELVPLPSYAHGYRGPALQEILKLQVDAFLGLSGRLQQLHQVRLERDKQSPLNLSTPPFATNFIPLIIVLMFSLLLCLASSQQVGDEVERFMREYRQTVRGGKSIVVFLPMFSRSSTDPLLLTCRSDLAIPRTPLKPSRSVSKVRSEAALLSQENDVTTVRDFAPFLTPIPLFFSCPSLSRLPFSLAATDELQMQKFGMPTFPNRYGKEAFVNPIVLCAGFLNPLLPTHTTHTYTPTHPHLRSNSHLRHH